MPGAHSKKALLQIFATGFLIEVDSFYFIPALIFILSSSALSSFAKFSNSLSPFATFSISLMIGSNLITNSLKPSCCDLYFLFNFKES